MLSQFKRERDEARDLPNDRAAGRRERAADLGSAVVADALAAKILHAWLQNRHQTLVPLTLNLRVLTEDQQGAVIDGLASLLLAGRSPLAVAEALPSQSQWLTGLGAGPAALARFQASIAAPASLDRIFERAVELDLAVYLYVAAVIASDTRHPASVLLADVVQARFDLPTAVVRSAARRYRR